MFKSAGVRAQASRGSFCLKGETVMPRKAKAGKTKLKTHKATSKRFRLTGAGKLMRTKGGKSHLRRRTSDRSKALLSEMVTVEGSGYIKSINRLAPHMKKKK
jgi:large subunit ribosomal protein L35